VTVPGSGTRCGRGGVIVHRSKSLTPDELGTQEGIPVTAPARTLLDLATQIQGRALERAVDEAERLRLCGIRDLELALDRHRGESGAGALGRVVRERTGPTPTRRELEERFLRLVKRHRLPQPLVNAPLHGLTVDFLWEAAKLVVEVDGRGSHDTHRGFQDDRDRDSLLAVHGYLALRFTWFDVTKRPAVVAYRVRQVLRDRRR
jgi:very-short-patch-repair endonuclease